MYAMAVTDMSVDSVDVGTESEHGMRVCSTDAELFLFDSNNESRDEWLGLFRKVVVEKVQPTHIISESAEKNIGILLLFYLLNILGLKQKI